MGPEFNARLTEQDRQRTGQRENNIIVGPECNARHGQRRILPWVQNATRDWRNRIDREQDRERTILPWVQNATQDCRNRTDREQYYRRSRMHCEAWTENNFTVGPECKAEQDCRNRMDREQYYRGSRMQREAWTENNITVGPECNARHGQKTILPWVQNATRDWRNRIEREQDRERTILPWVQNATRDWRNKIDREQDRERTILLWVQNATRDWRNRIDREQDRERTILPWVQNARRDWRNRIDREQDRQRTMLQWVQNATRGWWNRIDREQYYRGSRRNPVTAAVAQSREVKTVGRPGRKRGRVIIIYCGLASWARVESRSRIECSLVAYTWHLLEAVPDQNKRFSLARRYLYALSSLITISDLLQVLCWFRIRPRKAVLTYMIKVETKRAGS